MNLFRPVYSTVNGSFMIMNLINFKKKIDFMEIAQKNISSKNRKFLLTFDSECPEFCRISFWAQWWSILGLYPINLSKISKNSFQKLEISRCLHHRKSSLYLKYKNQKILFLCVIYFYLLWFDVLLGLRHLCMIMDLKDDFIILACSFDNLFDGVLW